MYLCYPKTGQQKFQFEKRGPGNYYQRWVVARMDNAKWVVVFTLKMHEKSLSDAKRKKETAE